MGQKNKAALVVLVVLLAAAIGIAIYLNVHLNSTNDTLNRTEQELAEIKIALRSVETELADTKAAKEGVEAELADVYIAKKSVEIELSETKAAKEGIETKLAETKSAKEDVETQLAETKDAKKKVDTELAETKAARESLETELAEIKAATESMETELAETKAAKEALETGAATNIEPETVESGIAQAENTPTVDATQLTNTYLLDVDGVQLYLTGEIEYYQAYNGNYWMTLGVIAVNNSSDEIGVIIRDVYLNGWRVGSSFGKIIVPGKKDKTDVQLQDVDVNAEIKSIDDLAELEFHCGTFNAETFEAISDDIVVRIKLK